MRSQSKELLAAANFSKFGRLVRLFALPLLALSSIPLHATSKLAEQSPFLPPGHGAKTEEAPRAAVPTQGPITRELEFRGVVSIGGLRQFSVFNKKSNTGYWIAENQEVEGIGVRGYDPGASTIIVSLNGRSERLTMKAATDKPLPVASSPRVNPTKRQAQTPQVNTPQTPNTNRRVIPRRRLILPQQGTGEQPQP